MGLMLSRLDLSISWNTDSCQTENPLGKPLPRQIIWSRPSTIDFLFRVRSDGIEALPAGFVDLVEHGFLPNRKPFRQALAAADHLVEAVYNRLPLSRPI